MGCGEFLDLSDVDIDLTRDREHVDITVTGMHIEHRLTLDGGELDDIIRRLTDARERLYGIEEEGKE